jgi:hypothetical protein
VKKAKAILGFVLLVAPAMEAADEGYVVLYRLKHFTGSALEPPILVDGILAAKMDNGRFITLALAPGRHQISSNKKNQTLSVDVKANQIQYIQMMIEAGAAKGHGNLLMISPEQASQDVSLVKTSDQDKIKDSALARTEMPNAEALAKAVRDAVTAPHTPPQMAPAPVNAGQQQPLGVEAILEMKKGQLPDDLILTMARQRGVADLGPESMIRLKAAGISEQSLAQLVQLSAQQ